MRELGDWRHICVDAQRNFSKLLNVRECVQLIDGLTDDQFYPLFDLSHQRTTSGNCSFADVIFQELLSCGRHGRGGRANDFTAT